ncbi:hypothetical protein JRO89_XS03G0000700 [Xanthoceras sorbifolium]|uniref:Target of rapamycin complex subunit LST8 n=1 Tax=Xanthoceras sorbifolium TaxID=99658 RepID=A0ABQ8I7T8_9ROSI|nr:hypothetical protein JRO89_XS03G0000700 [Xanthoceras sorbifolium]
MGILAELVKVPEVDTAVRSLTVMWDGSLVVAANNHGTCYVWRLMRGTQSFAPHRYLATASSDHTVKIWNVDGFTLEKTLIGHQRWTELISGDQNGYIRVRDLTANSCSCELVPEVDTAVRSLTVMWDGSLVVAANNHGTCYVWRLMRGTQIFAPHRYLATASSEHTVEIWNVDGFTLEKTLVGHQRWVWDSVFSVDGAYLITASSDTTARLWFMQTGEDIKVYQGHHKATTCCALHDGAEPPAC